MALSLYRKYRPNVFSDVVGQEHVERTLVNAIGGGSVASAYLFCGPRGTGKTTTARLLAKALLCERGPGHEPDGTCEQCRAIAEGAHPDVYELDAASRTGVDNVREEIISRVQFSPTRGRYKIYIIDEVHMLSTAAFNALLKTLEEPPEHVVFVLCTTDPHKVPETIQSRCQRFDFRRLSIVEIVSYLERICKGEGFSYEPGALEYIASKSAGGMRDATTSLEQVAVYAHGQITLEQTTGLFGQVDAAGLFELADHIARRDTAACFAWIDRVVSAGVDLSQLAHDLAAHVRDLYVTALTGGGDGIVKCAAAELPRYQQQAAAFGAPERLSRALTVCGELVNELRNSSDARLSVEIAMTRLCMPESDLTLESLAERVAALESGDGFRGRPEAPVQQAARVDSRPRETAPIPEPVPQPVPMPQPEPEPQPGPASRPEPAPQPAPQRGPEPQPAPQDAMSPERLLAAVLTIVRRQDMATGALLNGVTLQQDGGRYHLSFPKGAEFAMGIASKGGARDLIARAFREALGHEAQVDCRIDSRAAAESAVSSFGAAPSAQVDAWPERGADRAPFEASVIPPVFERQTPDFDAPVQRHARPIDDETAANLADALSAFGAGVKVEEVDDDQ